MSRIEWTPTFRPAAILAGLFFALGIEILLQQSGVVVFTPLGFWLSVILGALAGMLWSWGAHAFAVVRANREAGL